MIPNTSMFAIVIQPEVMIPLVAHVVEFRKQQTRRTRMTHRAHTTFIKQQ